jgi:phage tail sheath gpL-like
MSGSTGDTIAIAFNEIPYTWYPPGTYVEVQPVYDNSGLAAYPTRALIVAQMITAGGAGVAGTAAAGAVNRNVTGFQQARDLFGPGSQAAEMANFFFRANRFTPIDFIGIADAGGATKATTTITVTGPATANGTIPLYIAGGGIRHTVYVPVASGDVQNTIAANIAADINANPDLQVTAQATTNVVTLSSKHGGTIGNSIDVRHSYNPGDALPAGVALALPGGLTRAYLTGGATDPSAALATAWATTANTWYTDIALPFLDSGATAAELDRRFTAMGRLDAHAYLGLAQSYGTLLTTSATINSRFRSTIGVQAPLEAPWAWAASVMGVAAFNLNNDPSLQLGGLLLPGIHAPAPGDQFIDTQQNILLDDGITTYNVLNDGSVTLSRVVTENKTDNAAVPTKAWMDIMAPKVASRIRWDWRAYREQVWPRNKLVPDDSIAAEFDPSAATPKRLKGSWAARSLFYERAGWIENSAQTAAASTVQINPSDPNRADAILKYRRVGNLMTMAVKEEFEV